MREYKKKRTHQQHTWPPAWWRRSMRSDCRRHRRWPGCLWRRPWWPWGMRTKNQWRWKILTPRPTPNRHLAGARWQDSWPGVASLAHLKADFSLQWQKRGEIRHGKLNTSVPHLSFPACVLASFWPVIDYWSVQPRPFPCLSEVLQRIKVTDNLTWTRTVV